MVRSQNARFDNNKAVAENRCSRFNYPFEDGGKSGAQLSGRELKSLRFGAVSVAVSFAEIRNGQFSYGSRYNHEPQRKGVALAPLYAYIQRMRAREGAVRAGLRQE